MVVSGQTSLCLRKMVVLGKNGYSRPKEAVFRQKLLYLGEMVVFGQTWLYLSKRGCI